jgi:hypothetical protein
VPLGKIIIYRALTVKRIWILIFRIMTPSKQFLDERIILRWIFGKWDGRT